jgi:hypothetical protein
MGSENETYNIPDESCETLINAELRGIGQIDHLILDLRCECKMCTFGTRSSAVSREGENSMNTLKTCAKTAVKIHV